MPAAPRKRTEGIDYISSISLAPSKRARVERPNLSPWGKPKGSRSTKIVGSKKAERETDELPALTEEASGSGTGEEREGVEGETQNGKTSRTVVRTNSRLTVRLAELMHFSFWR